MELEKRKNFKEMMLKYQFAKKRLETEMEILLQEYELSYGYNPVEHIKSRVKTMDSIRKKLTRKGYKVTIDNILRHVHDVVGFRIVCSFLSDVYDLVEIIKSYQQFIIKEENDYIKKPKDSGYMSYHLNLLVPIHLFNQTEYIEVEVQIRTVAMDCWASLDHKLRYKLPKKLPLALEQEMIHCSTEMMKIDAKMQELYKIVKKNKIRE